MYVPNIQSCLKLFDGDPAVLHCEPLHDFTKQSQEPGVPHLTVLAGCTRHVMCRSCWCFEVVRCYNSLIGLFVDILQLLSGCMHPMLSITGSIVCQSYVTFTSICVCMCSCLFFMKSLTHDFDYIDNFVTFLFYVGRSHHLQKQLQK